MSNRPGLPTAEFNKLQEGKAKYVAAQKLLFICDVEFEDVVVYHLIIDAGGDFDRAVKMARDHMAKVLEEAGCQYCNPGIYKYHFHQPDAII